MTTRAALLSHDPAMEHDPLTLQRGDLHIDLGRCRVLLAGRPVVPTYPEYLLLVYLATRPGHVVTKRRLLEEGLGRHDPAGLRLVEEHVRHLKFKLERFGRAFIEEVDGTGYRFLAQAGEGQHVT